MKLLLIVNPCSGTKQAKRFVCDVVSIFMEYCFLCTVYITTKQGDATNIIIEHGSEFELIVCIGGDGTLNEVISGVMHAEHTVTLGYIPAGSTNDFANTMHLSSDIPTAARDIMTGRATPLDVGLFNNRVFSYVASFGAFTRTSYSTPQSVKNSLGHVAYLLSGIIDIGTIKPWHVKITADNFNVEDDYIFGAICNSTSVGGLITLNKSIVDMNDGLFEVLLIRAPKNATQLQEIIAAISANRVESCPMIDFGHVRNMRISTSSEMDWSLDGEFEEGAGEIDVTNIHSAISLIVKS